MTAPRRIELNENMLRFIIHDIVKVPLGKNNHVAITLLIRDSIVVAKVVGILTHKVQHVVDLSRV